VSENLVDAVSSQGIKVRQINLSRKTAICPRCGTIGKRHSVGHRRLREIGIAGPTVLEVIYSKHYCPTCRKHFSLPMDHLALPSGRFTNRVRRTAVDLVVKNDMTGEFVAEHIAQLIGDFNIGVAGVRVAGRVVVSKPNFGRA
jgi:transposase